MIQVKSTGALFEAREEHIVFPVSDQGCEPNSCTAMLFLKWPGILKQCSPFVPAGAIEEGGKNFYPLRCYSARIDGCEKTPEILEDYLTVGLSVQRSAPVGVILPGCSEMEMGFGADIEANLEAVQKAAEHRAIALYADLPDSLRN